MVRYCWLNMRNVRWPYHNPSQQQLLQVLCPSPRYITTYTTLGVLHWRCPSNLSMCGWACMQLCVHVLGVEKKKLKRPFLCPQIHSQVFFLFCFTDSVPSRLLQHRLLDDVPATWHCTFHPFLGPGSPHLSCGPVSGPADRSGFHLATGMSSILSILTRDNNCYTLMC